MIATSARLGNHTHELERHIADESRTLRGFAVVEERIQNGAVAAHGRAQHLGIPVVPSLTEMKLAAALVGVRENLSGHGRAPDSPHPSP